MKEDLRQVVRTWLAALALGGLLAGCGADPDTSVALDPNVADDRQIQSGPGPLLAPQNSQGFMWGVSTAGKQWEGYDRTSQWPAFELTGKTPEQAGTASDGMNRYDSDAALAQGMGLNAFRTSIEWSRIEPSPGRFDPSGVNFYHRLFQSLRAHGLTPVVTLMHFSYPQWLDDTAGGWEGSQSVAEYTRYVDFVSREYRNEVSWWLTFNEPNVFVPGAYLTGQMAPGKRSLAAAALVAAHFVSAHKRAYEVIHQNQPDAHVSFNSYAAALAVGGSVQSIDRHTAALDVANNDNWMMDALRPSSGVTADSPSLGADSLGGSHLDFIALDYYCRWHVSFPLRFQMAWNWEVYPQGFYNAITTYYHWFKLPVLVAENGFATQDLHPRADGWTREAYLVAHIKQMKRAMADGVPVLGYIHWSITDNWEWGSFSPRFGLYSVDCRNRNFRRVPTPAVDVYRQIVASGGTTPALEAKYPGPTGS